MKDLSIPYEVADRIAVVVMQDHITLLREEVRKHVEEGSWMHPEDYHNSMTKLIPSLEVLIEYFGEIPGDTP